MTNEELISFLADRLAEVDTLLTYVVDTARLSNNYEEFRENLSKNLGEVKITQAIDIDKWLADKQAGFVVLMKKEGGPIDYLRDDEDALPVIYDTPAAAYDAVPDGYEVIRILNLQEEYEKRQDK